MEEIYGLDGRLDLVITLSDDQARKKSGRVYVDGFCHSHSIPLVKIRNINDTDAIAAIRTHRLDWLFIIGWSQIAQREVLNAPARGVLGIHPTLLPTGRGRAAVPWAILKGLPETGVTLFQLDEGVDTGPILAQQVLPLGSSETATTLYRRVADAHRDLIRQAWPALLHDEIVPAPQDHTKATEWPGRTPADGAILSTMTVEEVDRLVRATTRPYPGAFWDEGETRLRIWSGRPIQTSSEAPPGAKLLSFPDGMYHAIEYDLEAKPVS